jgi:N-methylhydantoinase A
LELVTLRLRATVKSPQAKTVTSSGHVDSRNAAEARGSKSPRSIHNSDYQRVHFNGKPLKTAIHERDQLRVEKKYTGPAIITEYSATTVIPPGKRFFTDRAGNLVIEIQ